MCHYKVTVGGKPACTHRRHVSVHNHDILVPFASKLICQRQSENACANDDNPVAWAHHGGDLDVRSTCKLAPCVDP